MEHYLEIKLRPDPEFAETLLMSALFSKFHRGLVELAAEDIGVSFPHYRSNPRSLGDVLRIHGASDRLNALMANGWLTGMHDHIHVSGVAAVPAVTEYRTVRRRQFKTNVERLRRRRMKRHGENYSQAAEKIPYSVQHHPKLPYVNVRSLSTGQTFSLFIEQVKAGEGLGKGSFNAYGLSKEAAVPWF